MSYNPARMQSPGGHPRVQRQFNPHAGLKHSRAIANNLGVQAVHFEDLRLRKDTPYGWKIPIFSGQAFEFEYQYMCARNSTGDLRHDSKERCIRVLAGMLFVTFGGETITVVAHQSVVLKIGALYRLATSGVSDAELLICQTVGYEDDLVHVTPPEALNADPVASASARPPAPPFTSRREESQAQKQAVQMAAKQAERRAAREPVPHKGRPPLAGQQVSGVNPRPVGAGGYGEE